MHSLGAGVAGCAVSAKGGRERGHVGVAMSRVDLAWPPADTAAGLGLGNPRPLISGPLAFSSELLIRRPAGVLPGRTI